MFDGRQLLRGFGECVALLGLALAAHGQPAGQADANGACSTPSEIASAEDVQSAASTISSFEAPGAGTHAGQGTLATSINSAGTVAGYYLDAAGVYHGFVRAATGTFTSFEAPKAGTHAGQGTIPFAINSGGVITGYYFDASKVTHGFVRAANGAITSFDPPGAANTEALSINSAGVITGYFLDSSGAHHGFVRAANGAITTLNNPGGSDTVSYAINDPCGAITGFFSVFNGFSDHSSGLVRYPDGTFGDFDAPNAGQGMGQGTFAISINSAPCPSIAGFYVDISNVYHGFLRGPDGTFATFDAQGAGTGAQQGTQPRSINSANTVAGIFLDSIGANHGFVRVANGGITTFDPPGAGTGASQGTQVRGVNASGVITGYYVDSSNINHGFIRTP
jgi:hypothetical protein